MEGRPAYTAVLSPHERKDIISETHVLSSCDTKYIVFIPQIQVTPAKRARLAKAAGKRKHTFLGTVLVNQLLARYTKSQFANPLLNFYSIVAKLLAISMLSALGCRSGERRKP